MTCPGSRRSRAICHYVTVLLTTVVPHFSARAGCTSSELISHEVLSFLPYSPHDSTGVTVLAAQGCLSSSRVPSPSPSVPCSITAVGDHKSTSVSKIEKLEIRAGSDLPRGPVELMAQLVLGSRSSGSHLPSGLWWLV